MKNGYMAAALLWLMACQGKADKSPLDFKTVLGKPLTEISGLKADDGFVWSITDKPHAVAYKLSTQGKLLQTITVNGIEANDVEAVTTDNNFVYIGDVGDNDGGRGERQIIRFEKAQTGRGENVTVAGALITFTFEGSEPSEKKKQNNYDCESLMAMGDSLYLFTKRREDHQTELFVLPKAPGSYVARSLGLFDSHGLITDAAINPEGNEVALCGYHKGHRYPFLLLFSNFSGNHFSSGKVTRIELANKAWDWQVEGITYTSDNHVLFCCEATKAVTSTLYSISRKKIMQLNRQ